MTNGQKDKIEASQLTKHAGFWMRRVSNGVSHAFARKLEASGVTVAEWVVMREMYGGNDTTSPSVVAELTGLSRGAVSKLISRLQAKGLVTRKAVEMVPRLARLADENDEEFFGVLTQAERKELGEILKKIAALHKLTQMPVE